MLPEELLTQAQKITRQGITPTVRRGLELIAAQKTFDKLRKLRGKLDLGLDLKALRKDRR